jgi:hypothetical protein
MLGIQVGMLRKHRAVDEPDINLGAAAAAFH